MKQYRIENKEHIAEQQAEYYQDNKEEIQQQRSQSEKQTASRKEYNAKIFVCECKKIMTNSSKGAHRKVCPLKEGLQLRKIQEFINDKIILDPT